MALYKYTGSVQTVATLTVGNKRVQINLSNGDVAELPDHAFINLLIKQKKLMPAEPVKQKIEDQPGIPVVNEPADEKQHTDKDDVADEPGTVKQKKIKKNIPNT